MYVFARDRSEQQSVERKYPIVAIGSDRSTVSAFHIRKKKQRSYGRLEDFTSWLVYFFFWKDGPGRLWILGGGLEWVLRVSAAATPLMKKRMIASQPNRVGRAALGQQQWYVKNKQKCFPLVERQTQTVAVVSADCDCSRYGLQCIGTSASASAAARALL